MKRIDALKIGFLFSGIIIWILGNRIQNRGLMTAGLSLIVVAFALRFYKPRPPEDPAP